MSKIPVTVLTGFLGSGKTTLLNRILSEQHGKRIAVIENEFGEIGIDQALVINADEEVFEMNNGCICCTVRGDLIRILGNLMKRRDKFDHILVETTGMADPSPVAQTFFVDDDMKDLFTLDGIVTLVDAKHVLLHLDESDECKEQVAFGDVIVLNKTDLVSPAELDRIEARIRSMNALARVVRAEQARVPLDVVLNVGGFDLSRALEQKPTFLEPEYPFEWGGTFDLSVGTTLVLSDGPDPTLDVVVMPVSGSAFELLAERALRAFSGETHEIAPGGKITADGRRMTLAVAASGEKRFSLDLPEGGRYGVFTQHLPEEFAMGVLSADGSRLTPRHAQAFAAQHTHDASVTSVGIHADGAVDPEAFNAWLGRLLRENGTDIFRTKGILNFAGNDNRFVFQGVHMLLDGQEDRPWGDGVRACDLVFIGRKLDREALERGFRACLV